MTNKLKSKRHKKRRVVSSKKRRQTKPSTKRHRKKTRITRKTRGGVKRSVPSTPTQEDNQYNEEPVAPRKNRTRPIGDELVGVNLFQGFPGNQGNQENINPNQNVAVGTPPQTPMQQGPQTPVFTPINFLGPPQTPVQQENLFAQGQETPQGNLNNALDDAYMESITTPQTMGVPRDLTIRPFGYNEIHNDSDDDEPIDVVEEDYETEEEDDI